MVDIAGNCKRVMDGIAAAAERSGRDPREVRLLAAAKTQSAAAVRAAVEAGVRLVGENYVQEAQAKKEVLGDAAEWHLIGHLQRNKARAAAGLFAVIETLDNLRLAQALDRVGRERDRDIDVMVEVNLAGEATKSGVSEEGLVPLLREVSRLERVRVKGLMTVPPLAEDPEASRLHFRRLRELRDAVTDLGLPHVLPNELSMGMTHDYEVAVAEGSTLVRVGTALFGPRSRNRADNNERG
ncbi:MAG: YggS family pyridoxal phosphate-dependent enzyme [Deltaproteobacteria bacterium]|nr:YggS family pyridoxal phosphate-dependent enzyme [Deltaproteobacteria bacterium]